MTWEVDENLDVWTGLGNGFNFVQLKYPANLIRVRWVGTVTIFSLAFIAEGAGVPTGPINFLWAATTAANTSQPPLVTESNCTSANYSVWAGPPKYTAIGPEQIVNRATGQYWRFWHLGVDIEAELEYVVPDITHRLWYQWNFIGGTFYNMQAAVYLKTRVEQWVSALTAPGVRCKGLFTQRAIGARRGRPIEDRHHGDQDE